MTNKILIIDDEESVRDSFELALEPMDYEIITAIDGESGVISAVANQPQLIFLDLKMPGIDGVETLRQMRAAGVESPVYIVTAFMPDYLSNLSVAAKEGLRFGLGQKPLSSEQIRLIVKGMLETRDVN